MQNTTATGLGDTSAAPADEHHDPAAHTHPIGALDPGVASGWDHWRLALDASGITNDIEIETAGDGSYIPVVRIGTLWRVEIIDDREGGAGTFIAVFSTDEQAAAGAGEHVRRAHGLTAAEVIDFVRGAIEHANDVVYPDGNPFTAAIANATRCHNCIKQYDPNDGSSSCGECGEPR